MIQALRISILIFAFSLVVATPNCSGKNYIDNGICTDSCKNGKIDIGNFVCGCPKLSFLGNCVDACPLPVPATVPAPSSPTAVKPPAPPAGSIVPNPVRKCICADGLLLLKNGDSYSCVSSCPADKIKNISEKSCDNLPCSNSEYLKNGVCTTVTTGNNIDLYGNIITSCDSNSKCLRDFKCVFPQSNEVIDNNGKCSPYCTSNLNKFDKDKKCSSCNSSTEFFSGIACLSNTPTTNVCIAKAVKTNGVCKCPKYFSYATLGGSCVDTCATTEYPDKNGFCIPQCTSSMTPLTRCLKCPPNQKFSPSQGCVACDATSCPCPVYSLAGYCVNSCPGNMISDDSKKVCSCPPGLFYDPSVTNCVSTCLLGRRQNINNGICECDIDRPLRDGASCVAICSDSKIEDIINGTCKPQIFDSCDTDNNHINIKGVCTCIGTLSGKVCTPCATPNLYFDISTGLCTSCPNGFILINKLCVSQCPNFSKLSAEGIKTCTDTCDLLDPITNSCVTTCGDGKLANNFGICACNQGKALTTTGDCIECLSGITDRNGVCLPSCDALLEGNICDTKCSSGKVAVGRYCLDICNQKFYDSENGFACIDECNKKIDGKFCVSTCPPDKIEDGGSCICPDGTALNPDTNTCVNLKCNVGQELSPSGDCIKCKSGTYNTGDSIKCKKCPKELTSNPEQTMCVLKNDRIITATGLEFNSGDCIKIRMVPDKLNSKCIPCENNTQFDKATSTCVDCGNGKVSGDYSFGYCQSCKPGTIFFSPSTSTSTNTCNSCPDGFYRTDSMESCSQCFGKLKKDQSRCDPCSIGFRYDTINKVCITCTNHQIVLENICFDCGINERPSYDGKRCENCPPGQVYDSTSENCIIPA